MITIYPMSEYAMKLELLMSNELDALRKLNGVVSAILIIDDITPSQIARLKAVHDEAKEASKKLLDHLLKPYKPQEPAHE